MHRNVLGQAQTLIHPIPLDTTVMSAPAASTPTESPAEAPSWPARSHTVTAPLPDYDPAQYRPMAAQNYAVHPDWTWAQRCYEPFFYIHKSAEGLDLHNDMLILQARNSLCTMSLSPLHSLYTHLSTDPSLTVTSVAFTDTAKANIAARPKEGKSKKARHEARKRRLFDVCAGINGDLVHLNVELENNPQWLVEAPMSLGHVGVFYPRVPTLKMPHQVPLDEYRKLRVEFGEDRWPTLVGPKEKAEEGEEGQRGNRAVSSGLSEAEGQGAGEEEDASGGDDEEADE
ncbi:hypothetical protein BCR44DRAFT_1433097 [Catenaria anguillulae PL171]|uniref:Uncharacterized protein n=1 Tax=Catenaria anguillulae PL171 TaxID=765915 RepID=A0A1Y2HNT0_9FUNG|nr:hypothetical protein BCR44DRAFT_1433097 [Catenaria anguillulae PL171]